MVNDFISRHLDDAFIILAKYMTLRDDMVVARNNRFIEFRG